MGGNGAGFNASVDTTGVNRVNWQNVKRAGVQGGLMGMFPSIFTQAKDSVGYSGTVHYSGSVNGPVSPTPATYENGIPIGGYTGNVDIEIGSSGEADYTGSVGVSGEAGYSGSVDYSSEADYTGTVSDLETGEIKVVDD